MKRFGHAFWLLVLGGLLIAGLGAGCTGALPGSASRLATPGGGAGAQARKVDPNPTVCVEASSTPGGSIGTRRGPAQIGQTVPVSFQNARFDVTVTEVVTGQEAFNRLRQANQFNPPPPEGQEFVLFFSRAHITETSGDQAVFLSNFDWRLVDSTGAIQTPPSVVTPSPQFTGNGFAGATIEGWAAFTRKTGEQVSLVFGLETPQGTGGAWFAVS